MLGKSVGLVMALHFAAIFVSMKMIVVTYGLLCAVIKQSNKRSRLPLQSLLHWRKSVPKAPKVVCSGRTTYVIQKVIICAQHVRPTYATVSTLAITTYCVPPSTICLLHFLNQID